MVAGHIVLGFNTKAQIHHGMGQLPQGTIDQLLGTTNGILGAVGQSPGQTVDFVVRLTGRDAMINQTNTLSLGRLHQITAEKIFPSTGKTNQLRLDRSTAVTRDQVPIDVGIADLRAFRCDDNVVKRGHGCAKPRRVGVGSHFGRFATFRHTKKHV